jgi:uncharacterized membrane protein YczE
MPSTSPERSRQRRPGTGRRLVRLYCGIVLYGASAALQMRAALGLDPWNVLHQGVALRTGLSIGTVAIAVGAAVLLLWWPLRQRPGLGTVSNVVLVGLSMDATLSLVPQVAGLPLRVLLLATAVVLNGLATGLYITARFGPGPRDGLMTGLHRRTGRSVRLVRTCIEVTVLIVGFALGGSVGVGTVVYALAIGPLAQFFLRIFSGPSDTGARAGRGGGRVGGRVVARRLQPGEDDHVPGVSGRPAVAAAAGDDA